LAGWAAVGLPAQDPDFFERKIRPVLAERCYACHSTKTVATSGLVLDSSIGILRGGGRGPAVVPGDPDGSLLVKAISQRDANLKMPPTGPLNPDQVADFIAWVKMGALAPEASGPASPAESLWALTPLGEYPLPRVKQRRWGASDVDRFILARLEAKGLSPAPPADKRSLLRRVTFDLTGLPPTPREIADFLDDQSPQAFEKVLERLLASPHYGERWGRHWLDLVRFGETSGHEFDSEKPDAWRYRDYVIRAFNEDVPYDRFIREHIAGDLLGERRLSAGGTRWESPLGTGFFGLGEERNAADDLAEVRSDRIDNQIDVLGKTFLGLTLACARCHDHKFDPITTADYYALAGVLHSSRLVEGSLDSPAQLAEIRAVDLKIAGWNRQIRSLLGPAMAAQAGRLKETLLKPAPEWTAYLEQARKEPDHVFYPYAVLMQSSEQPFARRLAAVRQELAGWEQEAVRRGDAAFEDFEKPGFEGWEVNGPAFGEAPGRASPPNQALRGYQGTGLANSFGGGSDHLTGVISSRSLVVSKPFLHVRLAGAVDNTRRREHGKLRFTLQAPGRPAFVNVDRSGVMQWKTTGLRQQQGQVCFFEIADRARDGHIAVDKIVFSDSREPPRFASPPNSRLLRMLEHSQIETLEALADAYQRLFLEALGGPDSEAFLAALAPTGRLEEAVGLPPEAVEFQKLRAAAASTLPEASFGMVGRDDAPRDVAVEIRGNPRNLGPTVPRRFLAVVSTQPFRQGSGRLELAEAVAANPLAARVMVNRLWKHHFGAGIVRTVDNFGKTGEPPTHPGLLDFLAGRFIRSGWSVKALHRVMVLSSAYRMSSRPAPRAARLDPQNRLLHHMPVRRLEAEAIRDSLLAVSGSLDGAVYGPSVAPHISPYQDGRGKPASGPLDGNGRRSVYIQIRRNFIPPLFLAFDYPLPATTIGRRGASAVASQALMMMNNEFVAAQARKWAERTTAAHPDPRRRLEDMFLTAFARPPEPAEIAEIEAFLKDHPDWADLAHVLVNSKEFIFVR